MVEAAIKNTTENPSSVGMQINELAEELRAAKSHRSSFPIPDRLKRLRRFFQTAYNHFDQAAISQPGVPATAEWLLDNFYVLEQSLREVKHNLPRDYYARLPKVQDHWTRAQLIALALLHDSARLDINHIKQFIHIFQETTVLQVGELWALPLMLRLIVMETLADGLADVTRLKWNSAPRPEFGKWIKSVSDSPQSDSEKKVIDSFLNLRLIATLEWKEFFEATSVLEKILHTDPAGYYGKSDFETRNQYRSIVEELSRGSAVDEAEIASKVIQLSASGKITRENHVGYYLIDEGRSAIEKLIKYRVPLREFLLRLILRNATLAYLGSISFITIIVFTIVLFYAFNNAASLTQIISLALLALLPASAVAVDLTNLLVVYITPPRTLPKLDLENGVPAEYKTMVVIPSLLGGKSDIPFLVRQLENHFVANNDPNIFFALLSDFADAPQKTMPDDNEILEQVRAEIARLNRTYGNGEYRPFYLFHRERTWNPTEDCWMGWERKRGKLEEFNELLRGIRTTSYIVGINETKMPKLVQYVITLDADTTLPRESARRLIGTLAHVLNRAEFEPASSDIKAGYTILQPRVQVRPAVVNQSIFTRTYSGDSVIDLYTRAVSDVYQDLFGEGNYVGKGIYDVDAFQKSLHDRVPENHLLSHDLFEALHGACGLVTDIVLFEDYPPHYVAYTDRLNRWVRGDWQLLPWLSQWVPRRSDGKFRNTLSALDRWRIFDNLRRSLLAPASLILLVLAWLFLPGSSITWAMFALTPFLMPIIVNDLSGLHQGARDQPSNSITRPTRMAALRSLFEVIFLPHESLIYVDAIMTSLVRMYMTRRNMLQWTSSAHTVQLFGRRLEVRSAWQAMMMAPLFAIALLVSILNVNPSVVYISLPFLFAWLISPYIAVRINRPYIQPEPKLTNAQNKKLRLLARSTWLYFEHFVSPEDRWLPPDHFQESPRGFIRHQTSPTNIGLMLLSTLTAQDLGYVGIPEFSVRLRNTFDSMDSLERLRGHFLNWYDTRTLAPLSPRYISTVDSGNLAACLLALKHGCLQSKKSPIVQWQGLVDTFNMLSLELEKSNLGDPATELRSLLESLAGQAEALSAPSGFSPSALVRLFEEGQKDIEAMLGKAIQGSDEDLPKTSLHNLSIWMERVNYHMRHIRTDLQILAPWLLALEEFPRPIDRPNTKVELANAWNDLLTTLTLHPTLGEIPDICDRAFPILENIMELLDADDLTASSWCKVLVYDLRNTQKFSASLIDDLSALAQRAEKFFEEMNFKFLFDEDRHVFHIGFNVESGRMDPNYYDLIASEARVASLIAIARGDIPQNHWLYLARPLTELGGKRTLLSWSGTMFEYLMPNLFLKNYPNTLMSQSCRVAIEQQMRYASRKKIPWGISESSYYNFDAAQIYQYQAFGVPRLGYKRGLSDNLVVAPYASLLALQFTPHEVLKNLNWFEKNQMWATYGLYESVDFTPERLKLGEEYAIVRTYMAHHQGMILLSLENHLSGDRMIRRLHADPRIKSVELLLQEQTPLRAPTEHPRPQQMETGRGTAINVSLDPWRVSAEAPYHQVHCLSNGKYSTLITASGAGFSRWGDIELNRWRSDSTLDRWGQWIYVRDNLNGKLWSVTPQPIMTKPDRSEISFLPHRVEIERRDGEIVLQTSIVVAPEDDVEIRRVTMTNHGNETRSFSLTSYAEMILSEQAVDQRHPAYNKLFIESEFVEEVQCLLFHRRQRSGHEPALYLAHFFIADAGDIELGGYETDRRLFLGRGHTDRHPKVFSSANGAPHLSRTTGATLDPIYAMQADISLPAYETVRVAFVTLAAGSRKETLQLVERYRLWSSISRAFAEARDQVENECNLLNISSKEIERYQKLLSPLLFTSPALRADSHLLAQNTLGQSGLWSFTISGDYPILLIRQKSEENLSLLREALNAYTYWRRRGLMIDVVILNQRESGYDEGLQGRIYRSIRRSGNNERINQRGGIFVLREDQMNEKERLLMLTSARVILKAEAGSMEEQLSLLDHNPVRLPRFVPIEQSSSESMDLIERPDNLLFDNGLGGFSPDGREYVVYLAPGQWTPAPWVNVIATPEFGCVVSEAGLGCTWAVNSGENRLTPWHNDPVSDHPSEAIYLRDEDTGETWSPTPLPIHSDAPYLIRHGAGYTIFQHTSHGLEHNVRIFVAANEPVKIIQLKLTNKNKSIRRINSVYFAEWVLGTTHENTASFIVPEFASNQFALLARNPYNQDFRERVSFLACTREPNGMTADRAEFLGSHGDYSRPAALERVGLIPRVDAGVDPCAAMQIILWLQPGETKEVTFLLGQGSNRADAERLIGHFQHIQNVESAWEEVGVFWDEVLDQIQIETPDTAMNVLLNRWMLYQSLSSRFWGRTAFYQSSGAYGFRDQLQDAMGYVHTKPELLKEHILKAARYQFEEGDVLHWWHPPAARGIRTRCSDDLLWLPYVTAHYVESTGDRSILKEMIPFLSAEPLKKEEHERYGQFPFGSEGTLYDHCCRAIAKGTTAGMHGIPLMGAHDWNDGMNLVGEQGTGESVWLGWFLSSTLTSFARICDAMDDKERAEDYRKQVGRINAAIESSGWDGEWYRRAFYDDGFPLGSKSNVNCQIDSLGQSWAVISQAGDQGRVVQAMNSLYERLVDHNDGLVLLLTPPFDKTPRNPGYIKGYPPGIRENGAQYTHAALWAIWAYADLGQGERAHELFKMINPICHADTLDKVERYQVEPYVIAADVYSTQPHYGRGGWTWYTGSASWMYRLGVERLLGIVRRADHLEIHPCIPNNWKYYQINYRFGRTKYHIRVENPNGSTFEVSHMTINGMKKSNKQVPLRDDGKEYEVVVTME
jgi:cyclic beta-1,2-glucan synthetase